MPTRKTKRTAFCLSLLVMTGLVVSLSPGAAAQYTQLNIVSDVSGKALSTDSNLRNGWGLAFFPTSPFWVSDNDTGVSTLYSHFNKLPLVVTVPIAPTNPFNGPVGSPCWYCGQLNLRVCCICKRKLWSGAVPVLYA